MSNLKNNKIKNIQKSDPGKLLHLVISLKDDACSVLQKKINTYLCEECDAELVFAVVVNCDRAEAYIETVGVKVLEKRWKLSECQKFVNIIRSATDHKIFTDFHEEVQKIISTYLDDEGKKHVLLVPVVGRPFGLVVCLISPKEQQDHVVTFVNECFLLCWPAVKKTIQLEYECTMKNKCQHLLRAAKRLFTQVSSLNSLMKLATDQARHLINAEYCAVMLIDLDKMELVNTCCAGKGSDKSFERRFPMDSGIAGYVIKTGNIVNTRNTVEHPAYDPDIDNHSGLDIKTSLTFPIREQAGIIGVGQLINKIGEQYFDAMDEDVALSFSVYCGVSMIHSVVYEKIQETNIRHMLANELIMYHIKVSDTEVSKVLNCTRYHNIPDFSSLYLNTRGLALRELPCYVMKMFKDLGLIQRFNLKPTKLARFILQVRKSCRDVPHHNWCHAFSVTQWAYAALVNFQLITQGYFNHLQALMYMVACLMHDLDHRGSSSRFQINGETSLSALYSSEGSVMERHHLCQALCILNTEGCDVLETLTRQNYDRALILLKDFILATDLTNYFNNMNEYEMILSDYLKGNHSHIAALQSLLMVAADLSDQIKDWNNVKKTAAEVLTEFFSPGDIENGLPPITSMCAIPDLEIQFLTNTCVPLFKMLGNIFPILADTSETLQDHLVQWDGSKPIFAEVSYIAGLTVLLSPDLDDLIKASLEERERLRIEAELAEQEAAAAAAALAAAAAEEEF